MNCKTNNNIENKKLEINLLNVQCLTQAKMVEIEQAFNDDSPTNSKVFCLVETRQTRNNIKFSDSMKSINKMRKTGDKKGGGILILWKNNFINIEEIESSHTDLLVVKCTLGKYLFNMIVLYLSTNDEKRNIILDKEISKTVEKLNNENLLLLGDFNGHTEIIGKQKLNRNGKRVLSFGERYNLTLLNLDEKCTGEVTWEQNEKQSVIDFVLRNENMYANFMKMNIDDHWDILKISDHNLISVEFQFTKITKYEKNEQKYISFNKKCEYAIEKYVEYIENNIEENLNINTFNKILKDAETNYLKLTVKKKIKLNNDIEPMWINNEIKKEIAKKIIINEERRRETESINQNLLKIQYDGTI